MQPAHPIEIAVVGVDDAKVPAAIRVGARVYLSGANALRTGGGALPDDPAAQTHLALDQLEAALKAVGGSLANITKLTTCIVDRGYRPAIYTVIAERLQGVKPVSTGLVVAGLPDPGLFVQIDAEAVIPSTDPTYVRPYRYESWYGQGFAWEGSMVLATENELFVRGQTGGALDHSGLPCPGRTLDAAREHARLGMQNLRTLLEEAGSGLDDVLRMTVYIADRAYRPAIYPEIGKAFGDVHPVSTGIVTTAFAREDLLWEIDVVAIRKKDGKPHERLRKYHSGKAKYGTETQALDCRLCMIAKADDTIVLRGQTGMGLDEKLYGAGDVVAQTQQAMTNVETLLAEAGAGLGNVAKAVIYVTESDFVAPVNKAVLDRFGSTPPALTTVVVKGLASPELLMEIDITAIAE
jgi:enamine deaminase RidA (YjgF/YER057c/UK114 family)